MAVVEAESEPPTAGSMPYLDVNEPAATRRQSLGVLALVFNVADFREALVVCVVVARLKPPHVLVDPGI